MQNKNLYHITDTRKNRLLIDTGAAISICKPHVIPEGKTIFSENIIISGINGSDIPITQYFMSDIGNTGKPIKIYICNLQIDYDGILGINFLENYDCQIDLKEKILYTNFRTIRLQTEDKIQSTKREDKNNHPIQHEIRSHLREGIEKTPPQNTNALKIEPRCIQTIRIGTNYKDGDYFCPETYIKVHDSSDQLNTTKENTKTPERWNTGGSYSNPSVIINAVQTPEGTKTNSYHHSSLSDQIQGDREITETRYHKINEKVEIINQQKNKSYSRSLQGIELGKNTREINHITAIVSSVTTPNKNNIKQLKNCQNEERNTSAIERKIKIPEAIVTVRNNAFLTTIVNPYESYKLIELPKIDMTKIEDAQFIHNVQKCEMNENRTKEIRQVLRLDHLNAEEEEKITNLCLNYPEIFYLEGDKLSFTNQIKHEIKTTDSEPIFTKSYRYPQAHKQEVKSQIDKMLNQGIIQPSFSPWSSPVWVVPKKMDASGVQKWRIVIDYRKLNEKTIKDRYPLPNITDLLDQLGKCKYFTTIDLCSGFHQIQVEEKDIPKTAFTVENGHFEFRRLPFGLSNSPRTFSRVMDNVMTGLQGEQCLVYMDDVIVYSATLEEHIERLDNVFNRLSEANLKIQPDKCEFLRKEVAYLGHLVTPEGIKPNPSKVEAVVNFPQPTSPKEIKQFLGLSGYYRRFVPDYAKIIKPLTNLLKKNIEFNFNEKCVQAFNRCKILLTTAPILQYPDFEKDFIISTDASQHSVGAILSQGEINADLPVYYASRTLNSAETRYSTIERELLAIIWACKQFRPYIYGRKFILYTDHKPLEWLFNIKDPGSRLARWRLKLAEYDYQIKYRTGKSNTHADALSRIPINAITKLNNEIINTPITNELVEYSEKFVLHHKHKNILYIASDTHIQSSSGAYDAATRMIEKDVPSFPILNKSEITELQSVSTPNRKYFMLNCNLKNREQIYNDLIKNKSKLPNGNIYVNFIERVYLDKILSLAFKNETERKFIICKGTIEVPKIKDIPDLIKQYHTAEDNYHKGINETIRKIKSRFYWKNLTRDVAKYVRSCETCAKSKICRQSLRRPLIITDTPTKPFDKIYIDIFEYDKIKYLTILDSFSKYAQCYQVKQETSKEVIGKLNQFISHHPIPTTIATDNGACFSSQEFDEFCKRHNIDLKFISAHHPQSNAIERLHATISDSLRCYAEEHPTLKEKFTIPLIIRTYNNCRSSSTYFTPFEIIYGDINLQNYVMINEEEIIKNKRDNYRNELMNWQKNIFKIIHDNIIKNKEKSKTYHDTKYKTNETKYKIGDLIMIKNPDNSKQQPRFLGPFQILGLKNDTTAIIKQNFKATPIHLDRVRLYAPESNNDSDGNSEDSDNESEFFVSLQTHDTEDDSSTRVDTTA